MYVTNTNLYWLELGQFELKFQIQGVVPQQPIKYRCRRSNHEKAFRPFVCPSVCQTHELCENKDSSAQNFYTISKKVYPSFPIRRMVGGEQPLVPEILGQTDPVRAKTPIFNQYLKIDIQ